MKKYLLATALICFCLANAIFAMGERPKEQPRTAHGTPIFQTAPEQYMYAQELLKALQQQAITRNTEAVPYAFADYRSLFTNDRNVIPSYFYEAQAYLLIGNTANGTVLYQQFLEKDSKNTYIELQAQGQYLLGAQLFKAKQYDAAIREYTKVEQKYPTENAWIVEARKDIAVCQQALGNVSGSIKVLEDTEQTYPLSPYNQAYIYLSLGLSYQKTGNTASALSNLQKALNLPSDNASIRGPQTAAKIAYDELQRSLH